MASFQEVELLTPHKKTGKVLQITIQNELDTYRLPDLVSEVGGYIFVIWLKADRACTINFSILGQSYQADVTTDWVKHIQKVKLENLTNTSIDITPSKNTVTYYYEAYLAKGETDTSWTPAPEDIDDNYYTKDQTESKLEGIEQNTLVSSVEEYYLSTSHSAPIGGTWTAGNPVWERGKYIWNRRRVTKGNGVVEYQPTERGVCISGNNGIDGSDGRGVSNITKEYYLSTSKTSQIGGSWSTVMPQWVAKTYLWTRFKIEYENPVSIEYTVPICDVSWEEIDKVRTEYKAELKIERDKIESTVKQVETVQRTADEAKDKATNSFDQVVIAQSTIKQLSDSISHMVTGKNGESLMTQTDGKFTFDMTTYIESIDKASKDISDAQGDIGQVQSLANQTQKLANQLDKKMAYVDISTYNGKPCIELGTKDGDPSTRFKLRITNESIDFMQGSQKIAYISNHQLYIQSSVVTDQMRVGFPDGFVWKKRSNGNMGLRWVKGGDA